MEPSFDAVVRDADRLCEDLSASGRQRLLFLLRALDDAKPGDALVLAAEMENFVAGTSRDGNEGAGPTTQEAKEPAGAGENGLSGIGQMKPDTCQSPTATDPALLSGGVPRQGFLDAVNAGASNRQLAEKFGLTLRQANGLRIGLARRKSGSSDSPATTSRDDGVGQFKQDTLLGQKAASPELIEDMVRFLRQTGDIVVRSGEYYLINSRHVLTVTELVERANRKRSAQGRPLFSQDGLFDSPPPSHAAPGASGLGFS